MPRKKITFNDHVFEQDLKLFANNFCQAVAEEAKYDIWEFAQKQINAYYEEYDPIYYSRTDQERKYSFHIFSERAGNAFRGGIVFDNSIIQHEGIPRKNKKRNTTKADSITEDDIEGFVWALGYHGFEHLKYGEVDKWRPIQGEPNRFGNIQRYVKGETVDGYTFPKEKIIGIALNKAKQQKYSILHF